MYPEVRAFYSASPAKSYLSNKGVSPVLRGGRGLKRSFVCGGAGAPLYRPSFGAGVD
jgi:hypothetical protein